MNANATVSAGTAVIRYRVFRDDLLDEIALAEHAAVLAERANNFAEREHQSGRASALRWVAGRFKIEESFEDYKARYIRVTDGGPVI